MISRRAGAMIGFAILAVVLTLAGSAPRPDPAAVT